MNRPARRLLGPLALLVLLAPAAPAEVLSGRIFLGPGLTLYLEKDEGLFTEMLRALSLVDDEAPVVDLTALEISKDHLFLATDHKVYVRDEDDGEVHRVGRWTRPGHVVLDPGITLRATRTTEALFEGETRDALVVTHEGGAPHEEGVTPVALDDWLELLTETYLPGGMSAQEEEDMGLLVHALMGALPGGARPSAQQAEHLKRLASWVEAHRFENLAGIALVVEKQLQRLRGEQVRAEDEGLGRAEVQTLEGLTGYYESLESAIRSNSTTD